MARGLGLRERRNEAAPNAGASGPGGPGVERGSRRRRLKRRLVGGWSRRWRRRGRARERPAVAFLHAGVALFHARLAFLEHGRDLAALGVIQAVPDCQPLIAGLLHLGVELTAVLFGLRDQRARVELAAVQLRLEQVMALAPAARMASRRPRWLSWAVLTSAAACRPVSAVRAASGHGSQAGEIDAVMHAFVEAVVAAFMHGVRRAAIDRRRGRHGARPIAPATAMARAARFERRA